MRGVARLLTTGPTFEPPSRSQRRNNPVVVLPRTRWVLGKARRYGAPRVWRRGKAAGERALAR